MSADGRWLASASHDGTLRLWDLSAEPVLPVPSAAGGSNTEDSQIVVSGAIDGWLVLWDVAQGVALRRYVGISEPVVDLAFVPDGRSFLAAADDDAVHEYRVDTSPEALESWIVANRYVSELTCQQRAQFHVEPLCEEAGVEP